MGRFNTGVCGWVFALLLAGSAIATPEAPLLVFDWSEPAATISEHLLPEKEVVPGGLHAVADRETVRPGERYAEMLLRITPDEERTAPRELRAVLSGYVDGEILAEEVSGISETGYGILRADLRRAGVRRAMLRVELLQEGRPVAADHAVYQLADHAVTWPVEPGVKVALDFPDLPQGSERAWPVRFGVPVPAGLLWSAEALRLVDGERRPVPSRREPAAHWAPDGAVQWVLFDALARPGQSFFVRMAGEAEPLPEAPLRLHREEEALILETEGVRYTLGAGHSPIMEIHRNGRLLTAVQEARGLYVVDQKGRLAQACGEGDMVVEADGPVAVSVRISGFYRTADGEPLARHITRVEAIAGRPEVRVTHSLVLTRDSNETWFREIGWELDLPAEGPAVALLNTAREDPAEILSAELEDGGMLWMAQKDHTGIGPGENLFQVGDVRGNLLRTGTEMGDWAAWVGSVDGLMINCREAARQHPKEIALTSRSINLKLFSPRGGDELDFRTTSLIERWGLEERLSEENLARVAGHTSNAIGWSKTHEILLAPLAAEAVAEQAPALSRLHSRRVYAHVDPQWMCRTEALGALHPRDPDRFPEAEALIQATIERYMARVPGERYHGFVDYHAGPHYGHAGRYRLTYSLLPDSWLLYARSGDRAIRSFAEGSNRAFMDNYIAHWDGPNKNRGLVITASGGTGGWRKSDHPFYWEESTGFGMPSTAVLHQALHDYYLTGYRRAGDIVAHYAEALLEHWEPRRVWRIFAVIRSLNHAYGFTWDQRLRALAERTITAHAYDPEGELYLTKERAYSSSTYKTPTDVEIMIDSWNLLGSQRSYRMARAVAEYWWDRSGVAGRHSGAHAQFLYAETMSPAIAAGLDHYLRRAASAYDEEDSRLDPMTYSQLARVFRGIPYAMGVVTHAERLGSTLPAWVHFDDYGNDSALVVSKAGDQSLDLLMRVPVGRAAGGRALLEPLDRAARWGLDLNRVTEVSGGSVRMRIPKDAPAGAYRITPARRGEQLLLADEDAPLVLHAPGYWRPLTLHPPVPIYFELPEDSRDARIMFEGSTLLIGPDGQPFPGEQPLQGWVDLPAEKPGLWHFIPVEEGLVRVSNLPPFFAMREARFHFIPEDIEWLRDRRAHAPGPVPAGDPDDLFVAGAIEQPGSRALYLPAGRQWVLESGEDELLPRREGTIEFFFRPDWSTFDLRDGMRSVAHRLIRVDARSPWVLDYRIDPRGTTVNLGPREPSHSLFGSLRTRHESGATSQLRVWATRTVFESDTWVHVAWVWGEIETPGARGLITLPVMDIYVDGRRSRRVHFRSAAGTLPDPPQRMILSGGPGAAFDQLRVSGIRRYQKDFSPPSREQALDVDKATRVLFRFDESLEGEGFAREDPVVSTLRE